ncbi:unnamed protein product [Larinioides sclopetarius]|uniref:CRAL-TRIO domain-containing protein n=1 Tax=Larinioides sclopetarius TaxID=280406 RepID=A0AAV2A9D1_9ARAC
MLPPCRPKEIHIVNAPPIFLCAFNVIYKFIPKKIQDRLSIHSRNGGWQIFTLPYQ